MINSGKLQMLYVCITNISQNLILYIKEDMHIYLISMQIGFYL